MPVCWFCRLLTVIGTPLSFVAPEVHWTVMSFYVRTVNWFAFFSLGSKKIMSHKWSAPSRFPLYTCTLMPLVCWNWALKGSVVKREKCLATKFIFCYCLRRSARDFDAVFVARWFRYDSDGDGCVWLAYCNIILQVVVNGLDNKIFSRYKVHCCRTDVLNLHGKTLFWKWVKDHKEPKWIMKA